MSQPFDAVLLVAFGGPQGPDDVRPFLANVLRGRRVAPERVEEVAHHYELFGGVSPLTELTRWQAHDLRRSPVGARRPAAGARRHAQLASVPGRHADGDVGAGDPSRGGRARRGAAQLLRMSRSTKENVRDARAALVPRAAADVDVTYVRRLARASGFIDANADHVRTALAQLPPDVRERRAAGLHRPQHSACRWPSDIRTRQQLRASARLVAAAVGRQDWALVYQSRSGRPRGSVARAGRLRLPPPRARGRTPGGRALPDRIPLRSRRGPVRPRRRGGRGVPRDRTTDGARGSGEHAPALHRRAGRRGDRRPGPLSSGSAIAAGDVEGR